jgi:hypothetical protein
LKGKVGLLPAFCFYNANGISVRCREGAIPCRHQLLMKFIVLPDVDAIISSSCMAAKLTHKESPMKNLAGKLVVASALMAGVIHPSYAASLTTMKEVGAAIKACWTPPAEARNSSVTLSFSFKRDGTLIGPPRPTAVKVTGDAKARQSFIDAATQALQHCLPLSFSPDLAKGIAGTIFTVQFASKT